MTPTDLIQLGSLVVVVAALCISAYQVRLAALQTRTLTKTLQQATDNAVITLQTQARLSFFLDDPELLAWHLRTRECEGESHVENKKRLYLLTKMIAHETTFVGFQTGAVSAETWGTWEAVIESDALLAEAREIWPTTRALYAESFARYVDRLHAEHPELPSPSADPPEPQVG